MSDLPDLPEGAVGGDDEDIELNELSWQRESGGVSIRDEISQAVSQGSSHIRLLKMTVDEFYHIA